MDRTSREAREELHFRDALGLELSKTCHSLGNHSLQIFVLYMSVVLINAFLSRAIIGHLVWDHEPERLAGGGACHT